MDSCGRLCAVCAIEVVYHTCLPELLQPNKASRFSGNAWSSNHGAAASAQWTIRMDEGTMVVP